MPLTKSYMDERGYTAEYFEIEGLNFDDVKQVGSIGMKSWKDAAACAAKKKEVDSFYFVIGPSEETDPDNCVTRFNFADFVQKDIPEAETKLKRRVKAQGSNTIIDLTDAVQS